MFMNLPTVHIEVLSLVLKRDHLPGFGGDGPELAQPLRLGLDSPGGRVGQEVVQVLGEVIGLWRGTEGLWGKRTKKRGMRECEMQREEKRQRKEGKTRGDGLRQRLQKKSKGLSILQ